MMSFLLEKGADPNQVGLHTCTPLTLALEGRSDESVRDAIVQLLLEWGVDVNLPDGKGRLPLCFTIGYFCFSEDHCCELAQQLLKKGADTAATMSEGRAFAGFTPLTLAAKWGLCKVAELLIDFGANMNQSNRNGKSPLTVAREREDNDNMVDLLVGLGAEE